MQKENHLNNLLTEDEPVNYRAYFEKYLCHWKWFVFGSMISVLIAFVYLRYTPNIYEVNAAILLHDEENGGGMASEMESLTALGLLGGSKTSIDTEIDVLSTRTLMQRTVKELGINLTYHTIAKIRAREKYKQSNPIVINFLKKDSIFYNLDTSFTILVQSERSYALKDADESLVIEGHFGERIETGFGPIIITHLNVENIELGEGSMIRLRPFKEVADDYLEKIIIEAKNKKSNVITLSLEDEVKTKAEDILNNLVYQYNKDAVDDKQLIAKNTEDFINDRIEDVSTELTSVDMGVEAYKKDNKLTDLSAEAGIALQSNLELEKKIVDLTAQIKLIDYVQAYMKIHKEELIPANLGLKDETTSQSTLIYNQLLLERNRILTGSSKKNPTVINLEAQINTLKSSIDQSLVNSRSSLVFELNEARLQENRLNFKRSEAPKQEREFQDIKRKQMIIETLYLFLLEKREENAISLAVTAANAKLIDIADGSNDPVSPKKLMIMGIAIFLGLLIPFIIIYFHSLIDNKIHTVEELEFEMSVPILGDIPSTKSGKKIIFTENENTNVAEAFRLLRTNLGFMLPVNEKGGKSIFITSTIAGEGKTFVTINLAHALMLINKKVLIIGADIRKPKILKYLNIESKYGLTEYLVNHKLQVSDVITEVMDSKLDVISSGAKPPNPSELLTNGRFDEVIKYGIEHYDYVLVDTPPANLVTDTLLVGHKADLFVYVVRANYLDKRFLSVPKKMHENKRLPNMAILFNDTNYKKKGYGYGYGYKEETKAWWKWE